jgi:hypothetical protein
MAQIMHQLPAAFEFNEELLIRLADHHQSAWFGNFLLNCERLRFERKIPTLTTSLWSHVEADRAALTNREYRPADFRDVIIPGHSMKKLQFWTGYFLRHEEAALGEANQLEPEEELGVVGHGARGREPEHNTVVWVPDDDAVACWDCGLKFTVVVRRKHHCRACGHVFCSECSTHKVPLLVFGYAQEQRVCDPCFAKYRPKTEVPWAN